MKFLKDINWPYVIVYGLLICICVSSAAICVNSMSKTKEAYQDVLETMVERSEEKEQEARTVFEEGYAVYCDGILIDRDKILIDELLKNSTVVSINHEERYIGLKSRRAVLWLK